MSGEQHEVLYESRGPIAIITLNRPESANAQSVSLLYALDDAFTRAVDDDDISAIILCGAGKHFSSGHDLSGAPERKDHSRRTAWYASDGKEGMERMFAREQEIYLGLCRRWRELPKPTIAAVQGACIAGGLMLAWVCDFIIASDDAFFSDPVVDFGIPGVEYFAHPFEMSPRIAREFLMLGERMGAQRAYEVGMVNRVTPREELLETSLDIAGKLAQKDRFALALTKQAFNFSDDVQGRRIAMEGVFSMHHLAHAHSQITTGAMATIKNRPGGKKK